MHQTNKNTATTATTTTATTSQTIPPQAFHSPFSYRLARRRRTPSTPTHSTTQATTLVAVVMLCVLTVCSSGLQDWAKSTETFNINEANHNQLTNVSSPSLRSHRRQIIQNPTAQSHTNNGNSISAHRVEALFKARATKRGEKSELLAKNLQQKQQRQKQRFNNWLPAHLQKNKLETLIAKTSNVLNRNSIKHSQNQIGKQQKPATEFKRAFKHDSNSNIKRHPTRPVHHLANEPPKPNPLSVPKLVADGRQEHDPAYSIFAHKKRGFQVSNDLNNWSIGSYNRPIDTQHRTENIKTFAHYKFEDELDFATGQDDGDDEDDEDEEDDDDREGEGEDGDDAVQETGDIFDNDVDNDFKNGARRNRNWLSFTENVETIQRVENDEGDDSDDYAANELFLADSRNVEPVTKAGGNYLNKRKEFSRKHHNQPPHNKHDNTKPAVRALKYSFDNLVDQHQPFARKDDLVRNYYEPVEFSREENLRKWGRIGGQTQQIDPHQPLTDVVGLDSSKMVTVSTTTAQTTTTTTTSKASPTYKLHLAHQRKDLQVPIQSPVVVSTSDNSFVSASPVAVGTGTGGINHDKDEEEDNDAGDKDDNDDDNDDVDVEDDDNIFLSDVDEDQTVIKPIERDSKSINGQEVVRYSHIISSPMNELPSFGAKKYWHDLHTARIQMVQEEISDPRQGGINSAIIAILFGIGATGMLVMIVSVKMRSIRERVAYKGRRRSLVPDTDFLINTIPM